MKAALPEKAGITGAFGKNRIKRKPGIGRAFGAPSGTRTLGTLIKSQVLYQLS